jgi:hypothetical protein
VEPAHIHVLFGLNKLLTRQTNHESKRRRRKKEEEKREREKRRRWAGKRDLTCLLGDVWWESEWTPRC